jgi:hypothetical protein
MISELAAYVPQRFNGLNHGKGSNRASQNRRES